MTLTREELVPKQRAAVALMAMGTELAALIMRTLPPADVEQLTIEIANLRHVPAALGEQMLAECH